VLVLLALAFESVWHTVVHQAEHSYRYGSLEEFLGDHAEENPGLQNQIRHLQLNRELVNRAGGEFMTLGFLAFLIYSFNQLGGFGWLAETVPHDDEFVEWHYPETKDDWLHVAENVHMKLFSGMVCYFVLISRMAAGAVERIKEWERCQMRRFNPVIYQVKTMTPLKAVDESLADHMLWRRFFLVKMVRLQRRCPDMFHDLVEILGLDPEDDSFPDDFHEILDRDFSFSAYIALSVETGVCDSIQVHKTTWGVLLVGLGLLAAAHRFARIPVLALFAMLCLILMRLVIRHTRRSISRRVRDPTTLDVRRHSVSSFDTMAGIAGGHSSSSTGLSASLRFGERHRTELGIMRAFQIVLFLIAYVFSRTTLDFHDWRVNTESTMMYTCLFALLLIGLAYDLPNSVPLFLGMMAMPPHMDRTNFATFCAILLKGRESNENKALSALRVKLTRGGTVGPGDSGDCVPTMTRRAPLISESSKDMYVSEQVGDGNASMRPRISNRSVATNMSRRSGRSDMQTVDTHVHERYQALFRSALNMGRQKGLGEAEFLAGLALHVRRAVPLGSWPPRAQSTDVPSEFGGLMDSEFRARPRMLEGIDERDIELCEADSAADVLKMNKVLHL